MEHGEACELAGLEEQAHRADDDLGAGDELHHAEGGDAAAEASERDCGCEGDVGEVELHRAVPDVSSACQSCELSAIYMRAPESASSTAVLLWICSVLKLFCTFELAQ